VSPVSRFQSLVALRHRNFRLIWVGLLVSYTGTFMQNAAILWHVSLLVPDDRKALALGLVGLSRVGPIVVFSMVSGVAADSLDRRKLLIATQLVLAVLATVLAALTFSGLSVVWPIYLITGLSAAGAAFDLPARQALIPMLVPREDLPGAISLSSIMLQTALVAGPSLGGLAIASLGLGWVYAFNAVSYAAVVVALLMMRGVKGRPERVGEGFTTKAAFEGLRFVFRAPLIRSTMLLDFFATFFSSATALLPIFAQDILHVGAHGYGWLYAAPAAGALVASGLMVPAMQVIERRGVALLAAVGVYGCATIVFGFSTSFWLTFSMLALSGAADSVSTIYRNVIRQLETPDELRGRMTGVNMVFFMGGPQLGELEAGLVANWVGAPLSVITGGIGCLVATTWVAAATPGLRAYVKEPEPAPPIAPGVPGLPPPNGQAGGPGR
jgi:MFS family permease